MCEQQSVLFYVMIIFEVQVLVGVGWFSVHGEISTAVVIDVYTGVQEGEDPVAGSVVKIMFGSILLICRVNSST